jgi:O-antigen/teichoic acid export membrane protein
LRRLDERHTTLLANLAIPLIGALSGVLLARALGPADRGVFALIQTLPLVVATVASVGMAEAVAYHVARAPSMPQRYAVLRSGLAIVAASTAGTLALILAAAPWISGLIEQDYRSAFLAALLYIPALTFGLVAQGWYRGANRIPLWNLSRVMPGALWACGVIVVSVWHPTVFRMSTAMCVSGVLALLTYLAVGKQDLVAAKRTAGTSGRPLLAYGLPSTLSTLPRLINLRFDQLLLLAVLPKEEVGFYVAAVAWASLVPAFSSARAMNSFTAIAALAAADRWSASKVVLLNGLKVASAAGVILALLAPAAFTVVFGAEFDGGQHIAAAMSLAGIALAMMTVTTNLLWACGLPKQLLASDMSALAVTLLTPFRSGTGSWCVGRGDCFDRVVPHSVRSRGSLSSPALDRSERGRAAANPVTSRTAHSAGATMSAPLSPSRKDHQAATTLTTGGGTSRRDQHTAAILLLLPVAAFGPYVAAGLRAEQIVFYGSALLFLPAATRNVNRAVMLVIALWLSYIAVSLVSGWTIALGSYERGNYLAGVDGLLLPLSAITVGLGCCESAPAERSRYIDLVAFSLLGCLVINTLIAIISVSVDTPWLGQYFWTASGTTDSVGQKSQDLARFSGVFNQPAEAGTAYAIGLQVWFWLGQRAPIECCAAKRDPTPAARWRASFGQQDLHLRWNTGIPYPVRIPSLQGEGHSD